MPTSTVENYLKEIYHLQQSTGQELVSMGRLAREMAIAPGTATAMIKTLADSDLVSYEPRAGVRLTEGGRKLALHVLRRHRLIELFLVQELGLGWSEVHDEAEELEHAVSDKVLEKIDELLGRPLFDPHGAPIPSASGELHERVLPSLASCPLGQSMVLRRVLGREQSDFLNYLDTHGLGIGRHIVVEQRDEVAEALLLRLEDGSQMTLGASVAKRLLVEPA